MQLQSYPAFWVYVLRCLDCVVTMAREPIPWRHLSWALVDSRKVTVVTVVPLDGLSWEFSESMACNLLHISGTLC